MKIKKIAIWICEACLDGEGEECHTPGCSLFLHSVDLPINGEMYEVLDECDEPCKNKLCQGGKIFLANDAIIDDCPDCKDGSQ